MSAARVAGVAVLAALAAAGGCGDGGAEGDPTLDVYLSLPLRGADGAAGRDAADGARLALAEAPELDGGTEVEASFLDNTEGRGRDAAWTQAQVARNARAATQDSTAIAYVGELESDATRVSLPITNEAGALHISPAPVDEELLRERPGGTGVPRGFQTTGQRTLGALLGADRPLALADLPPAGREMLARFERRFQRRGGPWAVAGYEAVAIVLDSVARATDPLERESVVDAFLATANRDSVLGSYSVDAIGRATFAD